MLGLQCPKLLWCIFNAPERIPPVDEATQALFDQGHEVGDLAKTLYPDGIEVDNAKGFESAIEQTHKLMHKKKPLFEATFHHKRAHCRTDILVPNDDGWDIIEVKSSSRVKDDHPIDVAFQRFCLEGTRIHISRCHLMHVNNEYVKHGPIDPKELFVMEDVTEQVAQILPSIGEKVDAMLTVIKSPTMPAPVFGTECVNPKECPVCLQEFPENSVTELVAGGQRALDFLNHGVLTLGDIPAEAKLNDKQRIQREAAIAQKPHIDKKNIAAFLDTLAYPLHFLDFETVNPAIPLFDGTRPFQHIPFQLSLHTVEKRKTKPKHIAFLADTPDDPRPGVVEALKAIKAKGSIIVYNAAFEKRIIEDLAVTFPTEKWLHALGERIVDLIVPFRSFWYYHPAQHGSTSLKAVLPALTGKSYEHLEISQGDQAARAFFTTIYKEKRKDEKLRAALLDYCAQDTRGMVEILRELEKMTKG